MFSIWLSKFYAIYINQNQLLLDWGLELVIFDADWNIDVMFMKMFWV